MNLEKVRKVCIDIYFAYVMDGTFTRCSPDGTSRTEETRTRLPASFSGQLILSGVKIDSEVAPVVDRCTEKAGAERMPFATCPVPSSPLTEGYEEQLEHHPQSKTTIDTEERS
jgi:hypothetical protein